MARPWLAVLALAVAGCHSPAASPDMEAEIPPLLDPLPLEPGLDVQGSAVSALVPGFQAAFFLGGPPVEGAWYQMGMRHDLAEPREDPSSQFHGPIPQVVSYVIDVRWNETLGSWASRVAAIDSACAECQTCTTAFPCDVETASTLSIEENEIRVDWLPHNASHLGLDFVPSMQVLHPTGCLYEAARREPETDYDAWCRERATAGRPLGLPQAAGEARGALAPGHDAVAFRWAFDRDHGALDAHLPAAWAGETVTIRLAVKRADGGFGDHRLQVEPGCCGHDGPTFRGKYTSTGEGWGSLDMRGSRVEASTVHFHFERLGHAGLVGAEASLALAVGAGCITSRMGEQPPEFTAVPDCVPDQPQQG